MKKYIFTPNQINISGLINSFNFDKSYTTSSQDVFIWLNIQDGNNYATLGFQRNNAGFISHISLLESQNLLNNL